MNIVVCERNSACVKLAGFEDGRLADVEVVNLQKAAEGNIYLGRLTHKIELANGKTGFFVEIGDSREAFINAEEYDMPVLDACEGEGLIVQVSQEQRAEKGARLVRAIQIVGVNLVYCPYRMSVEASSKITDKIKADEYVAFVKENMTGQEGWILRTSAVKASFDNLLCEMEYLRKVFDEVLIKAKEAKAPALLQGKSNPLLEFIGKHADNISKIVLNARNDEKEIAERFGASFEIEIDKAPFKSQGVDEAITEALQRDVRLKSGGRISIEETKALVAIDVDSGEDRGNGHLSRLNMEAAEEIVRQIRLRNLSGKIVIDFAGISEYRYLKNVIDFLEEQLSHDSLKTTVFGLSRGGNVEIVRARRRPTLLDVFSEECPVCRGTGRCEKQE